MNDHAARRKREAEELLRGMGAEHPLTLADAKAISALAAMDQQRALDRGAYRHTDSIDEETVSIDEETVRVRELVRLAIANWLEAHPAASSHYMRIVHNQNLGDPGGDWCCWAANRDDMCALARLCGVGLDDTNGHWESQTEWVFDDVPVVVDPVCEAIYEGADAHYRTHCRANCATRAAREEADADWHARVLDVLADPGQYRLHTEKASER